MSSRKSLETLLHRPEVLLVPGCFDALSARLTEMGFNIVAHPLTLLFAVIRAQEQALKDLKQGLSPTGLVSFKHLKEIVGFPEYRGAEKRYAKRRPS